MTRWRVDHEVKSDLVLVKNQNQVVFKSPDASHEICLMTRRGPGKHAADELYLSAHVILEHDDPLEAADKAETYLHEFLDILAVVTNAFYRMKKRTMIVDWTPGLTNRRCWYFKEFPNPHIPNYALNQDLIDTVSKYATNSIPLDVRLAIGWWARGVAAPYPSEQFQYFWYALEILAEHLKPTTKIATKCAYCQGDLQCPACNKVPLHRPYPKEAIRMIIDKHMRNDPALFFEKVDGARNRLLHGQKERVIEQETGMKWEALSDNMGKLTWAALLDTLGKITLEATSAEHTDLSLIETNTFVHYHMTMRSDLVVGARHADPFNPQIDEFSLPGLEVNMIVSEHSDEHQQKPAS